MPKYEVTLVFDCDYVCEVEADCEEDAFQEALRACDSDFHFKALEEVWVGDYSIEQIDDEEEGL